MSAPKWLQNYYGKKMFDLLNPTVVMDGDKVAVVRLQHASSLSSGNSRVGYVLLRKDGKHNVSAHQSLHEGIPTQKDMDRMKKVFEKADA